MTTYIVRRLLQSILILIGLSVFFFAILTAEPGGPCNYILANPNPNTQTLYQTCIKAHGLDQPKPIQYFRWVNLVVHGDFGVDYTGAPVLNTIKQRLPATVLLIGVAYVIQELIGLPLGVLGALKRNSFWDQFLTFFSYIGLSLPTFWLGLMLILIFAVKLGWLPPGGIVSPSSDNPVVALIPPFGTSQYWAYLLAHPLPVIGDFIRHLILPAVTLVIIGVATDSRFMRASMLDVISLDYVRTARAKGLPQRTVVIKHALRNALLPIITNFGLFIPGLVSGAIITERIFGWPGMGKYFTDALGNHDTNTLLAVLLCTALFTLIGNLVADLLYGVADPRIRYD